MPRSVGERLEHEHGVGDRDVLEKRVARLESSDEHRDRAPS